MCRFPRGLAAMVALFPWLTFAADRSAPFLPVWERFAQDSRVDRPLLGRILLTELGCVNCHESPLLGRRPGPNLDGVGARVRISHLRKMIHDPRAAEPGTLMPQLLAHDPDRSAKSDALLHLLASTGSPKPHRRDLRAIIQGFEVYTRIGCVACHGPLDRTAKPIAVAAPVMVLTDLHAKYSLEGLTNLLEQPHRVRPSGRMPALLDGKDARRVAQFLLQHSPSDITTGLGTTNYRYYEGAHDRVPNFDSIKPTRSGLSPAFDIEIAPRSSDYALRFDGYFRVERDGEYIFTTESDDGSVLWVDGQKIVDNDGLHGTKGETGKLALKAGVHHVVVGFFQLGGGAELRVGIEGPNLPRRDLGEIVAATEEGLNTPSSFRQGPVEDRLEIQPELAARGQEVFAQTGCANCHSLTHRGQNITSWLKAPKLEQLDLSKGCLTEHTPVKYDLSESQREALKAALKSLNSSVGDPRERVQRTLLSFNCVACHAREGIGGPPEALNASFTTSQPEMGDEARIPPPLDGVGGKMNPDYLRMVVDKGVDDRPYMHVRMPGFGSDHMPGFVEALLDVDKSLPRPEVRFETPLSKVKAAGRFLVGSQALSCIKCHTFAGQRAEGVQGIDLTIVTRRLQPGWFHRYLLEPQRVRPGTRMPASWPDGETFYPNLLGGKTAAQIEAIWQYLGDGAQAQRPVGLGQQSIPLLPSKSAIVYRAFIQGAGTRGIGVGYPERANLAFDANEMRLALIWQGAFIDAARHWTDRGAGFEGPLGDNVVRWHEGVPFVRLEKPDTPWPAATAKELGYRFRGYRLTPDDRPTFLYSFENFDVEDFPNAVGGAEPFLLWTLRVRTNRPVSDLYFRAAVGDRIESLPEQTFSVGGMKMIIRKGTAQVRRSAGKDELLIPVRFDNGQAEFQLEIHW